jgi:hypothetical protein
MALLAVNALRHARLAALLCFAAASLLVPGTARAADDDAVPAPDRIDAGAESEARTIDRTWLYADDARVAAPMRFVGTTSASWTAAGAGFAGNTAVPGAMVAAGGEGGLVPGLSVMALGQVGLGGSDAAPDRSAGAIAGLRWRVTGASAGGGPRLVLSVGYLREAWQGPVYDDDRGVWLPAAPGGASGAWAQAAIAGDLRRLRLAATVHAEHVFSAGRDGADVMVETGGELPGDGRAARGRRVRRAGPRGDSVAGRGGGRAPLRRSHSVAAGPR